MSNDTEAHDVLTRKRLNHGSAGVVVVVVGHHQPLAENGEQGRTSLTKQPKPGEQSASPATTPSIPSSTYQELRLLLELAVPTIWIQLGFTIPPFLTASYVGRTFGAIALDGFQLANLICNLFTLSLLSGLYSASDTLSPQAYGAGNYREVGLVAIRGFLSSLLVVVPACLLILLTMERGLIWFGEDVQASYYAYHWYRIYALSLPFYVLYMVTWKFLSAQGVMGPLLIASTVSCFGVLPLALQFLTRWLGFPGSAAALLLFQMSQTSIAMGLVLWQRPYRPETWPGLHADVWREVLHWKAFKYFFYLGMGGMMASSEWIYWETLSLAIGTLGVIPLSVHTVPTQVITVLFMIPLGLGIALAVRLGVALPRNPHFAQRLTVVTLMGGTVLFCAISTLMYVFRQSIFQIFITDPLVLQGCEQIWWKVCFYYALLSMYALNMGVAIGLGMQWTLGVITFAVLWGVGLPSAWYFGVVVARSLDVTWHLIYPPYVVMNALLWTVFWRKDWDAVAKAIRAREGIESIELTLSDADDDTRASFYGSICEERLALVEGGAR